MITIITYVLLRTGILASMNEFKDVDFENLLYTYKAAIDVNMIASVTDEKGKILYVNKKFCEVSGYTPNELIGQNHSIVNSRYHSKDFFANLWATLRSGNIWQGEIKNKTRQGDCYWVDTVILPIKAKRKTQYLSLRKEITKRKQLEEKKEEYLRALENLFFMISHQVRAPVCNILGLLELRNADFTKEDLNKILMHLNKSANDLDKFTREMHSYLEDLKDKLK